ncbi:MAG: hypothetical protein WC629_02595 [Candidatus Paceibacterota bacterium]|jgi:hypothetical protein
MKKINYYELGLGPHDEIIPFYSNSIFKKVGSNFRNAFSKKGSISSLIIVVSVVTFVVNSLFFYFVLANTHINDNVQKPGNISLIASFVDSL